MQDGGLEPPINAVGLSNILFHSSKNHLVGAQNACIRWDVSTFQCHNAYMLFLYLCVRHTIPTPIYQHHVECVRTLLHPTGALLNSLASLSKSFTLMKRGSGGTRFIEKEDNIFCIGQNIIENPGPRPDTISLII